MSDCLLAINSTASIQDIPSAVSIGLPAAEFRLGDSNETEVPLRFRLDICAGINTGNLPICKWLMTKYPEIVNCYKKCVDSDPFEPIIFEGALNVDSEK